MLPVRRDRGKVERSGGKTVMLAMPPACPRRSQSRRGLRCLVPASRSSDQPSISPLSIHPQADYSVITHTHSDSPSQLAHPLVHSLPHSHWKAVTIHMSEADAWLYIQLRWYSIPLPSSLPLSSARETVHNIEQSADSSWSNLVFPASSSLTEILTPLPTVASFHASSDQLCYCD